MKNKTSNPDQKFLKKHSLQDVSEHHKTYLGTTVPEDYFSKSKLAILDQIKSEQTEVRQPERRKVFLLKPMYRYAIAASVMVIMALTVWLQYESSGSQLDFNPAEYSLNDDVLIESLLVEDDDIEAFADATLFEEVIVKAELSEQKLENLILDVLILEDTLLDDYINKELVESIVL